MPVALLWLAWTAQAIVAQAPGPRTGAPQTPAPSERAGKLPVRRVVLYKTGVGYFEHVGRVRGSENVAIDFNSTQLNDVLKSLTALDLGDGRITNISYNSDAPFAQRLGALRLPLGEHTTVAAFFGALRGARLEVHAGVQTLIGRVLSVEKRSSSRPDGIVERDELTIVTDGGEIRTIELSQAVTVKLAERDSADQVSRYLTLLASTRAQDRRRMIISTAGSGDRDLLVSYISEVPIWKTTYRIVLPSNGGGKPRLQGWAIVDNTIGEDWNGVELSLVAGVPQSFVQQISQPYFAERPVVPLPKSVLLTPQTHQATLRAGTGSLVGMVTDPSGMALPGVDVRAIDESGDTAAQATSDERGEYSLALPTGTYSVQFVLAGFRPSTVSDVAVEGGAQTEQNAHMSVGAASETVTVTAESPAATRDSVVRRSPGFAGGAGGGRFSATPPPPPAAPAVESANVEAKMLASQSGARGEDLGELFQYRVTEPVTIRQNQSALVPIVASDIAAERVSLWTETGMAQPLRALWLTNSSPLTLDGGSFTVLDEATFAGEGLMAPMKPGERRLLSYAVDLGVQVQASNGNGSQRISRIRIARGVASQRTDDRTERVYTIRNNDTTPRTVVVEHRIRQGWTLLDGTPPSETSAGAYRFRVAIDPKKEATLRVAESHPVDSQLSIVQMTDDQLALFVRGARDNSALVQALTPVTAKRSALAALSSEITARQLEMNGIGADQARVRENMKSLRGSAEEQFLLKRYATELNQQEDRLQALRKEVADLEQKRQQVQSELAALVEALSLDVDLSKP
jgi:hypothetical protein